MGKRVVPESYHWDCDACGLSVEGEHRPKHWSEVAVYRDAYDMMDNAAADGTIRFVLCQPCSKGAVTMLNTLKPTG